MYEEIAMFENNADQNNERFYPLLLEGIETPYVESLSSYLSRQAVAHSLLTGTLLTKKIGRLTGINYLIGSGNSGGSRFYESATGINGLGKTARNLVKALNNLTYREDLHFGTMLPWEALLPSRGLMKSRRSWCPVCLQEMKFSREVIYEPLIWNLQSIISCSKHGCYLEVRCPGCAHENYVMNRHHIPGYCSKCFTWLGTSKGVEAPGDSWNSWVMVNISEMFLSVDLANNYTYAEDLTTRLKYLTELYANGNVASFARLVNKPKVSVWSWINGKNRPTLEDLLTSAYNLGISLKDFLHNEILVPEEYTGPKRNDGFYRKGPTIHDKEALERHLKEIVENGVKISVRETARILGIDKRILYNYFPDICKTISEAYLGSQKESRENRIRELSNTVATATVELWNIGIYPSRRAVETYTGMNTILREREVQDAWKRELDLLSSLPNTKDSFSNNV